MPEEKTPDMIQAQNLILSLDEARRKDIDAARVRMEEFLKGQLDLQHKMEIIASNQNALKERFEEGVSKRLTNLDAKMDKFLIEWGQKKKEDEMRDERLADVKATAADADKKAEGAIESAAFYGKAILSTIVGGLGLAAIIFIFETFRK